MSQFVLCMYDVYSDVNRAVWCGGWVAVGPAC